ncbi:hypothetical protein [Ottowia sp.]|uniref:hypothetical protein n=1 Tax=Ottowia sp. TaxID=1898956 RepID=UPI0025D48C12|nr:hypothetical protein [Ottowia sp.]MBK6615711.1 hypothetical protein [Ottowia sp.]MBK6746774.1 hypothetical protein [Ottowia sp.]
MKVIEAAKVSTHAAFLKMASGQLPFLGSVESGGGLILMPDWVVARMDTSWSAIKFDGSPPGAHPCQHLIQHQDQSNLIAVNA